MRKFLWSIPALTIYIYAINVLIQWGIYSYLGVPAEYVDASISSNIISIFSLSVLGQGVLKAMGWWTLLLLLPIFLFQALYFFSVTFQKLTVVITPLVLLLFFYGCFHFGEWIGKVQTYYYAPENGCITIGTATGFIVPGFSNGEAILVPINAQNQMIGGFTTKAVSQIPCTFRMREVGRITK